MREQKVASFAPRLPNERLNKLQPKGILDANGLQQELVDARATSAVRPTTEVENSPSLLNGGQPPVVKGTMAETKVRLPFGGVASTNPIQVRGLQIPRVLLVVVLLALLIFVLRKYAE